VGGKLFANLPTSVEGSGRDFKEGQGVGIGGGESEISSCVHRVARELKFADPLFNDPSQLLRNEVKRPLLKCTTLKRPFAGFVSAQLTIESATKIQFFTARAGCQHSYDSYLKLKNPGDQRILVNPALARNFVCSSRPGFPTSLPTVCRIESKKTSRDRIVFS
jgi:hypothetical protein